MSEDHDLVVRRRDETLRRWGLRSWYLVGLAAAAAVVFAGLSAISGLVIPLIVATVVAMLFAPLTDALERSIPRPLAAAVVLVGLVAATIGAVAIAINSVIDQAPEIGAQLAEGIDRLGDRIDNEGWTRDDSELVGDDLGEMWTTAVPGAMEYLSTVFSSATSFVVGSLVGIFLLYFGVRDWHPLSDWVAARMGVAPDVGRDISDDANWAIRQYFAALTVSSLIVAAIVGAAIGTLGVPLAFTIAVVTFATSYIPYLGAIISGAATLIALGSGGFTDAVIILIVVLVAQNVVQTVVQTKLTEGSLKLHPIAIFGSTIAGGAVFGVLGAALSTPLVAIGVQVLQRLRPQPAGPADADNRQPLRADSAPPVSSFPATC